jgi:excisionase family DNA binding protein
MGDAGECLTIAEAARLVGVHRNTVRNRIKAGLYRAHKVVTPQGETYAIERASLDAAHSHNGAQGLTDTVRHNGALAAPGAGSDGAPLTTSQQAQADVVVQRLLAPFIAELGTVREELGRERERRETVERQRDHLQAEVDALRAAATAAEASQAVAPTPAPIVAPEPPQRAWWAFWRRG